MRETSSPAAPARAAARPHPTSAILAVATVVGCVALALVGYIQPVVMGIVQGLGEFLPISSSAHLILVPWFFGWQGGTVDSLTFDVALHLGTLIALVIYFWRDWVDLLRALPGLIAWVFASVRSDRSRTLTPMQSLLASIAIATVPGAIAGLALDDLAEHSLRAPLLIAATLTILGVLLYVADRWRPQHRSIDRITWRDALLIGLAQGCALIPGVSRSGATITMARALAYDRVAAARFSFLLSAPITAAAVLFKLGDIVSIPREEVALFAVGVLVSALVGALAIRLLLAYVRQVGFGIFAAYRVALAIVVVLVALAR